MAALLDLAGHSHTDELHRCCSKFLHCAYSFLFHLTHVYPEAQQASLPFLQQLPSAGAHLGRDFVLL